MNPVLLDLVTEPDSLILLSRARVPVPGDKVIFRESISQEQLDLLSSIKVREITGDVSTPLDFSHFTNLKKVTLTGFCSSLDLPPQLEQLYVLDCQVGFFRTPLPQLTRLDNLELIWNDSYLPESLTRLVVAEPTNEIDERNADQDVPVVVPLSVTDLTLPGLASGQYLSLPASLTALEITREGSNSEIPLSHFPHLTSLKCWRLPASEYQKMSELPLTTLAITSCFSNVPQLIPLLPQTLTTLDLEVYIENYKVQLNLPRLTTLSFRGENLVVPGSVRYLKVSSRTRKKVEIDVSSVKELEELIFEEKSLVGNHRWFNLLGSKPELFRHIKIFEVSGPVHVSIPELNQSETLKRLMTREIIGDWRKRYPNLTELEGEVVDEGVIFPQDLQILRVNSLHFSLIPPGLVKLQLQRVDQNQYSQDIPYNYVFSPEVWRNLVQDQELIDLVWPKVTPEQEEQINQLAEAGNIPTYE